MSELNSIGIYISTGVSLQTDKSNFSVEFKAYNSYCIFFWIETSVIFSNFKRTKGESSSILLTSFKASSHSAKSIIDKL